MPSLKTQFLHEHQKGPVVLLQSGFTWQEFVAPVHSSLPKENQMQNETSYIYKMQFTDKFKLEINPSVIKS